MTMTPKERAKEAIRNLDRHWEELTGEEMEVLIEQAIIAAVAETEERGRRIEREACAGIVDASAGAFSTLGNFDQSGLLHGIAQTIRARSGLTPS